MHTVPWACSCRAKANMVSWVFFSLPPWAIRGGLQILSYVASFLSIVYRCGKKSSKECNHEIIVTLTEYSLCCLVLLQLPQEQELCVSLNFFCQCCLCFRWRSSELFTCVLVTFLGIVHLSFRWRSSELFTCVLDDVPRNCSPDLHFLLLLYRIQILLIV